MNVNNPVLMTPLMEIMKVNVTEFTKLGIHHVCSYTTSKYYCRYLPMAGKGKYTLIPSWLGKNIS